MEAIAFLREVTHDLHMSIESRFDFSVHFASLASYRQLLTRYYGFYLPFEAYLYSLDQSETWAALGIDFNERRKAEWLKGDLESLGLTPCEIDALPMCPPELLPRPHSESAFVGCTYVLEGATLGGTLIARHIEQSLGLPVGAAGARFFYGYGPYTGTRWNQFRRYAQTLTTRKNTHPAVERGETADQAIQQAVIYARQTFTTLEKCLFTDVLVETAYKMENRNQTI